MFYEYPYVDLNQPNLDAIIRYTRESLDYIKNYTARNKMAFAGTWTPEKAYKIWSVVQDSEGNGYISVKPVPENVLVTDTEYWQPVAGYDALYEAFNSRISDLETDNEEIKGDITALETDNTSITNRLDALDSNIVALNTLKGLKCVLIGDSYAMGSSGTSDTGWIPQFILDSGCDAIKTAKMSSAGFIEPCGSGDYIGSNFVEAVTAMSTELTASVKNSVDLVLCCGGINDVADNDVEDIGDAVLAFISATKAAFPNAKIAIVPLYCDATFGINYKNGSGNIVTIYNGIKKRETFAEITLRAVTHGAISTPCAIYWLMGRTTFGTGDGIHPNQYGFIQQSRRLINWLNGGDPRYIGETFRVPNATDCEGQNLNIQVIDGLVTITGGIIVENPANYKTILNLPQSHLPAYSKFFTVTFSNGTNYETGCIYYSPADRAFNIVQMPTISPVDDKLTIYINMSYYAGV